MTACMDRLNLALTRELARYSMHQVYYKYSMYLIPGIALYINDYTCIQCKYNMSIENECGLL